MKKYLLLACAWASLALGCIGAFLPVLPTTPLVLLSTFLFAKSSPRLHRWICGTRVYAAYVEPFQKRGGIPLKRKLHILALSYTVMAASAFFVRKPLVWAILGTVALFLLWLMCMRIPTVEEDAQGCAKRADNAQQAIPGRERELAE